jgi:hypothetical protein
MSEPTVLRFIRDGLAEITLNRVVERFKTEQPARFDWKRE